MEASGWFQSVWFVCVWGISVFVNKLQIDVLQKQQNCRKIFPADKTDLELKYQDTQNTLNYPGEKKQKTCFKALTLQITLNVYESVVVISFCVCVRLHVPPCLSGFLQMSQFPTTLQTHTDRLIANFSLFLSVSLNAFAS